MVSETTNTSSSSLEIIHEFGERQDFPKRKRHKVRVSCLNCYASKRKCDRNRPCARCTRLGLTEFCLYEHLNPISRDTVHLDETTRLNHRIAELESVILELRNRPYIRDPDPRGGTPEPGIIPRDLRSRLFVQGGSAGSTSVRAPLTTVVEAGDSLATVLTTTEFQIPAWQIRSLAHSPLTPESPVSLKSSRSNTPPITSADDQSIEWQGLRSQMSAYLLSMGRDPSLHALPYSKLQLGTFNCSSSSGPNDGELECPINTNNGIEAFSDSSRSPSSLESRASSEQGDVCNCLSATPVLHPLLHFALALRNSREALQGLHTPTSHCALFRRIVELEEQIFSATPPALDIRPNVTRGHDVIVPH